MLLDKARQFIGCLVVLDPGWNKITALAHAWHETAGFARVIGQNNYWGVKVPQRTPWKGLTAKVLTTEYARKRPEEGPEEARKRLSSAFAAPIEAIDQVNGLWRVKLPLWFIDFPTCEEALIWYDHFIARLYPDSYALRFDPAQFFAAIVNPKLNHGNQYATDPGYARAATGIAAMLQNDPEVRALLVNTL